MPATRVPERPLLEKVLRARPIAGGTRWPPASTPYRRGRRGGQACSAGSRRAAAPRSRGVVLEPAEQLTGLKCRDAVLVLDKQRLCERQRPMLLRGQPVAEQRRLRACGEFAGERERRRQRLTRWREPAGEPHPQRLLSGHAAAREDQVKRVTVSEQARQANRPSIHERDAPAPAEDAEHRILGGHAQVAPRRELEATSYRMPFDRR